MNKKPTPEDLKVWKEFTSSKKKIENKDYYFDQKVTSIPKIKKVDLHGLSLDEANKKIEILVDKYFIEGNPDIIKTVNDVWKFSKNMWNSNPNWYLVETQV